MRQFEPGRGQRFHAAANESQTVLASELGRIIEKELHAEAYPQQRRAASHRLFYRVGDAGDVQPLHAFAEGAHAGQYQFIRAGNRVRIRGNDGTLAENRESVHHASEVPRSVIDDRYHKDIIYESEI